MLKSVFVSPAVQAAMLYGVAGLGFAVGNILFARALPPEEFVWVTLVLAVSQLAYTIGPLGADTLVVRYHVNPSRSLAARISRTSFFIALVASLIAWSVYGFSLKITIVTVCICLASSINLVGASFFRSREKFLPALILTQSHNIVVLVAAAIVIALGKKDAIIPLTVIAVAYAVSAFLGWVGSFRLDTYEDAIPAEDLHWGEGRTILATGIAIILLIQIERLIIPKLLDNDSLATFAVLAAVAGSPFRILQMAVGYTLVPRLRQAKSAEARRQLVRSEAVVLLVVVSVASIVVLFVTQPFVEWFLQGKYRISDILLMAAIVAGIMKVISSFTGAGVTALGSDKALTQLNRASWFGVLLAIAGAMFGSAYGLPGLVFGVSVGWMFQAMAGLVISWRHFL